MPENQPLRILIADDHEIIRESLSALLTQQKLHVVAAASNGLEAIDLYRRHQPDITLMDLRMPHMDGLTAIRTIVAEFPQAQIIVLTSFDGETENSLRAGAKALVQKDAPMNELLSTIRAVYSTVA
jgi:two-component system NarL family response regulator